MMTLAVKLALTGALVFFMTGLLTGVWKYRCIMASAEATAPYYVDIAHRASLQYSFASILLAVLAGYSVFPEAVNAAAPCAREIRDRRRHDAPLHETADSGRDWR